MIYFTSDTHFFHKNILKYMPHTRPFETVEEMNEDIIQKWNDCVKINDDVYHLGDLSMGHKVKTKELIPRLNGRIHLIRGNHDHYSHDEEKELFASVDDYRVVRYNKQRLVCLHYPMEEWDRCHYGDMHLHGHCHGDLKRKLPNRIDVGWDVWNRPLCIDEILSWKTENRVTHHGEIL